MSSQTTPTIRVGITDLQRETLRTYGFEELHPRDGDLLGSTDELAAIVERIDQGIDAAGKNSLVTFTPESTQYARDRAKSDERALKAARKRVVDAIETLEVRIRNHAEEEARRVEDAKAEVEAMRHLWGDGFADLTDEVKVEVLRQHGKPVFDAGAVDGPARKQIAWLLAEFSSAITAAANRASVERVESRAKYAGRQGKHEVDPETLEWIVEDATKKAYSFGVQAAFSKLTNALYAIGRETEDVVAEEVAR